MASQYACDEVVFQIEGASTPVRVPVLQSEPLPTPVDTPERVVEHTRKDKLQNEVLDIVVSLAAPTTTSNVMRAATSLLTDVLWYIDPFNDAIAACGNALDVAWPPIANHQYNDSKLKKVKKPVLQCADLQRHANGLFAFLCQTWIGGAGKSRLRSAVEVTALRLAQHAQMMEQKAKAADATRHRLTRW